MVVWKYPIPVTDEFSIEMPDDSEILSMQVQHGEPQLWALVDPGNDTVKKKFILLGTGHHIDGDTVRRLGAFVGTFQLHGGSLVFHLWEHA